MKQLTSKYRKDELSPAELQELRNQVNAMPDPEIEQEMYQAWMEEEIDETPATSERMDKIRERIDKTIKAENSGGFRFIRFFRMAAAVLLPVFVALTGYLYYENRQMTSEEMIVTTARGERASVTLPDGTTVSLNSESRLGYFPKTYNKKERKINFNGEGYFQVRKNQDVPARPERGSDGRTGAGRRKRMVVRHQEPPPGDSASGAKSHPGSGDRRNPCPHGKGY